MNEIRVKTHIHTIVLRSHVYVLEVLRGVLYPEAHNNGFEKKKKRTKFTHRSSVIPSLFRNSNTASQSVTARYHQTQSVLIRDENRAILERKRFNLPNQGPTTQATYTIVHP